jgi:isopenicillin-N N-acyltransferase like protein
MPERRKNHRSKKSIILAIIAGLILLLLTWFHFATKVTPPIPGDLGSLSLKVENPSADFYTCGNNWLKKTNSGLWELYIEGKPFERGVINGKLTKGLIEKQEEAFTSRLRELVPSSAYIGFLKYFIYWFDRNLDKYIPEEYKLEIYGISLSASDKYDFIGSGYQRMLNFHSAHDIGHAVQNMGLVGCTAFGVWGDKSADGSLLIGRNFDFYVGDAFSENKLVTFEKPDKGYPFMMIGWGSMIGVMSGMNDRGLTVTINAARSDIPWSARTPISILAREILQYAKNIKEALDIAGKRETFVSESILIGSAEDNKAVIIEKSPSLTGYKEAESNYIICVNHFQSPVFFNDPKNRNDRDENASVSRYQRVLQDIAEEQPLDITRMAAILRDRAGLNNKDIGMGNEKAINQLIAHHSVIFDPTRRLAWVSASPWQLGCYVCYDLNKIFHTFAGLQRKGEITEQDKILPADSFFGSEEYRHFLRYRQMRKVIKTVTGSSEILTLPASFISEFIITNPEYFEAYSLSGDYYQHINRPDSGLIYYRKALGKDIPRWSEKKKIIEKMSECILETKRMKE